MELTTLGLVVICGTSVSADSVRRGLWLPRQPDLVRPMRFVVQRAAHPGTLSITQHAGYVLVHGRSALTWQRAWLDHSAAACRVFAFQLMERQPNSWWSLYEEGRRTRMFDESTGRDLGERRGYEPPRRADERPAERIRAIYRAMTEHAIEDDIDLEAEVGVWLLDGQAPRPKTRSEGAGGGRSAGGGGG